MTRVIAGCQRPVLVTMADIIVSTLGSSVSSSKDGVVALRATKSPERAMETAMTMACMFSGIVRTNNRKQGARRGERLRSFSASETYDSLVNYITIDSSSGTVQVSVRDGREGGHQWY